MTGFYEDGTVSLEYVAIFVPKEIGIIIKKYLDIPEDEREDIDFDFSFEGVFETGGGVAFLRMPYPSDDSLPKPCQLFGPELYIQDSNGTAERKGVDYCEIIEDDADNTFQWRFYLA